MPGREGQRQAAASRWGPDLDLRRVDSPFNRGSAIFLSASSQDLTSLPAGIGLRAEHSVEFLETQPDVGFIEVHAENYFGRGGRPLDLLRLARRDHALSLHGVGLSIGSTDPLCETHLQRTFAGLRIAASTPMTCCPCL